MAQVLSDVGGVLGGGAHPLLRAFRCPVEHRQDFFVSARLDSDPARCDGDGEGVPRCASLVWLIGPRGASSISSASNRTGFR
eukprot:8699475-Pyramimonas_sp.AAC.1